MGGGAILSKGDFFAGTNFRYFHSYKHFRGEHEETERVENGTEVINDSYFLDFLVSYGLTDRLSANLVLPFVYHERSSMYEHGGNPEVDDPLTPENEFWAGDRHKTYSKGLSDIRFGLNYWLLDPSTHSTTNFAIGLGMKLNSGNYRAEDTFYNPERTANVDQSIQPGDGGVGATIEVQGFHAFKNGITLTGNLYYLINPREQYDVVNFRGDSQLSVPDQYAARLGGLFMLPIHGLSLYGGGRIEGIPSSDFIGGDEGFRRPGYILSLEPGINYSIRNFSLNVTVPVAVKRARTQNYSDKQRTIDTGVFRNGDAAFADYLLNIGLNWRFGKSSVPKLNSVSEPVDIN